MLQTIAIVGLIALSLGCIVWLVRNAQNKQAEADNANVKADNAKTMLQSILETKAVEREANEAARPKPDEPFDPTAFR